MKFKEFVSGSETAGRTPAIPSTDKRASSQRFNFQLLALGPQRTNGSPRPLTWLPLVSGKMAKVSELYDITWEEMWAQMRTRKEEKSWKSDQMVLVDQLVHEYDSKLGDIWEICQRGLAAALGYRQ